MNRRASADTHLSIGYYSTSWPIGDVSQWCRELVGCLAATRGDGSPDDDPGQGLPRAIMPLGFTISRRSGPASPEIRSTGSCTACGEEAAVHRANTDLYRRALVGTFHRAIAEHGVRHVEMEETFGRARWLQEATRLPVCVRLHGPWFQVGPAVGFAADEGFRERVEQERRAIQNAAAVTTPWRDILEKTRAFYGLELGDAEVIPNPTGPATEHWRLDRADPWRVLFVGRFDRLKGGDLIIDAFARVLQEVPEARLWFVGPDRGCDTSNGRTWRTRSICAIGSPMPSNPSVSNGSAPSRSRPWPRSGPGLRQRGLLGLQTFPNTVLESLALGCPIVAANVGGIPEIVRDDVNGLLHRASDPVDLASKIIRLMKAPKMAATLGQQGAIDCQRAYHPEVIAARTVDFYRRVIEAASASEK